MSKTTVTAVVMGVVGLGLTAAYIFGKIETAGFATSLAAVGTFGGVIIGILAKDDKKS